MRTFARHVAALLLAAAVSGLVATCGQKGPLRLPDEASMIDEHPALRL